jgi:hypothetical protein
MFTPVAEGGIYVLIAIDFGASGNRMNAVSAAA